MKWWRRLPGWHRREIEFRDWYISLLERVSLAGDGGYEQALRALKCPEQVLGYREVRYPKQEAVRQAIEAELVRSVAAPAQSPVGALDGLRQPTHV
jgi:hypothetical protein